MHIAELFESRTINGRKAIIRRSHHVYLGKHSPPRSTKNSIPICEKRVCCCKEEVLPLGCSHPTSSNPRWLGTTHAVAIKYKHEKSILLFLGTTAFLEMARGGQRKEPSTGFLLAKLDCGVVLFFRSDCGTSGPANPPAPTTAA